MRPCLSELPAHRINLDHTINSGQVFLWRRHGRFWYGIDGQNVLKCDGTGVVRSRRSDRTDFFRTDRDVAGILRSISRDRTVRKAVRRYPGLVLPRQDPFQCLVTFIASSNASVQKIRSGLEALCAKFGKRAGFDGHEFLLFPEPGRLAGATVDEIRACGLGYRSRYIREASGMVSGGLVDFGKIGRMGYFEAKEELRRIPGVGNKVADCIMLFSLDRDEAFPLDRWMVKVLQRHYPERFEVGTTTITDRQYDLVHGRVADYFGPHAGYAQQFLFKMEREEHGRKWQ